MCRRDGLCGNYICGLSPQPDEEPSVDNLEVDYEYFDQVVWPILAHRIPAFEAVKVYNDLVHLIYLFSENNYFLSNVL